MSSLDRYQTRTSIEYVGKRGPLQLQSKVKLLLWCIPNIYCRSGFDCEILMIANCEFSETHNQKNHEVSLSVLLSYGTGSTIAIIRITISLDKPNLQSLNYIIKIHPTVSLVIWLYNCSHTHLFVYTHVCSYYLRRLPLFSVSSRCGYHSRATTIWGVASI